MGSVRKNGDVPSTSPDDVDLQLAWAVVDAAPDAVIVTDAHGAIVMVNQRSVQLFGYSADEFMSLTVDDLLPASLRGVHADHRVSYSKAPRRREMGSGLELVARRRDESEFPVEVSLSPLTSDRSEHVIATVRDVTERKRADEYYRIARHRLAMIQERERIGRDLHDTVIQRLYGAGLGLEAALVGSDPKVFREKVSHAVTEIDDTISEIRTVIFDLSTRDRDSEGLQARVTELVTEQASAFGFTPTVHFVGHLDGVPTRRLTETSLAVIREAVSNAGRHAGATRVVVDVEVDVDDKLIVRVSDDGDGFEPGLVDSGSGLGNMKARAVELGGCCSLTSSPEDGTTVHWEVPLSLA